MSSLKDTATQYEPPQTKNIADLKKVSTDVDMQIKTVHEGEADEFSYHYFVQDGEEYRVPITVLVQLKEHLAANPSLEWVKVSKKGEGLKTTYTVIPIQNG